MSDDSKRIQRIAYLTGWYGSVADRDSNRALSMLCADLAEAIEEVREDEVLSPPRIELWEAMRR